MTPLSQRPRPSARPRCTRALVRPLPVRSWAPCSSNGHDAQHGGDHHFFQRGGWIVERGEEAAGNSGQRCRATTGVPTGADPESAENEYRQGGRKARQQRKGMIPMQPLCPPDCTARGVASAPPPASMCRRKSRMSCRRSTNSRIRSSRLPRITSFQPARGSVSACNRAMRALICSASLPRQDFRLPCRGQSLAYMGACPLQFRRPCLRHVQRRRDDSRGHPSGVRGKRRTVRRGRAPAPYPRD
jgi:hypothetical protein